MRYLPSFSSTKHQCLCALVFALVFPLSAVAQQQAAAEQELQQVQGQIKKTEQQLRQQQRQLQQAETALQQADKALSDAANALRQTTLRKQQLLAESKQLEQEQKQLEQQYAAQEKLLAKQLKSAYSMGQHDYSRLLLNQQDIGKLERVLTYYQYFNQARMQQLALINQTAQDLASVIAKLAEQQQALAKQLQTMQQQQQQLTAARTKQQASISQLQQLLTAQGNQLSYLRQNETNLQNTLAELQRLATLSKNMTGLSAGKGKYPWPLQGQLLQRFGENRQGGMPARGIVIQGENGANVQAIADGQVIYADWLKGYGWVIVLDHGAGFMSLYGHNQTLLRQPGQNVSRGEAIALVGASGGQAENGLYFEIREKGAAVNPLSWLIRR